MKRKYPVLVHKDNSVYGITVPDIPGCFTAGETVNKALLNLQGAVQCYYEGEDVKDLPVISNIEDLMKRKDLYVKDGFWLLAEIDFSFLSSKTVRINITVSEYKLAMIDKAAKEKGVSRSAFLVDTAVNAESNDYH